MNHIPRLNVCLLLLSLAWCSACGDPATSSFVPSDPLIYRIEYVVNPQPGSGTLAVTLQLSQASRLLRELRLRLNPRISELEADGELSIDGDVAVWAPPASGGTINWLVSVVHRRNGAGYDTWLDDNWGIFRAEDIIPRAATRTLKGARSETWLKLELPVHWSGVTQYFGNDDLIRINNKLRNFDQPSGWILLGNLGVRRETISGVRVAVAGPVEQSVRRMDILALLNWTLPELARLLPEIPSRLTIVSAGDPMWRGGLSAPQSLYIHADRPLISENATSTLLHEIMHLSLGLSARSGYDWITEGLAEYYSVELLHRSGTISKARYARAKADLATWARSASALCQPSSTGATTALAVGVLTALDEEIRSLSKGSASLDDLARRLVQIDGRVDLDRLASIATELAGNKPDALHIDKLPGCRTLHAGI